MKILAFSHTGLVTGGAEQCLLEYVGVLSARGHKCKVIMPHDGPMREALVRGGIDSGVIGYGWAIRPHKKVNTHKLQSSNGNSLTKIFNEVEKFNPDLILVNTSVIPWGLYAGRTLGVPSVLLVHEILNDKDPSLEVLPSYDKYASILNHNTDSVIYNSKFVKNEFKDDLTAPNTSKKILYPLPPLSQDKIAEVLKENKIGKKLKIAIFGALAPRKNQLEAVEAAAELRRMGVESFEIDLFGDKAANVAYVQALRRSIKRHSLEKHVKLRGYTNSVYQAMNDYNVVLSTSTYEPFGRTIVEGQLFGRVVVANKTGGGPELIKHEETGFLYELGNPKDLALALKFIVDNPDKALNVAAKARKMQTGTFLTDSRYDALIETVEYYDGKKMEYKERVSSDLFNPLRSLYEYNHQLNVRYVKFERIIDNRATRTVKGITIRSKSRLKRIVKEYLAK